MYRILKNKILIDLPLSLLVSFFFGPFGNALADEDPWSPKNRIGNYFKDEACQEAHKPTGNASQLNQPTLPQSTKKLMTPESWQRSKDFRRTVRGRFFRSDPIILSQILDEVSAYEAYVRDDLKEIQAHNGGIEIIKFKPALNLYLQIMRRAAEEVNPGYKSIVDSVERDVASGSKGLLTILEPARMRVVGMIEQLTQIWPMDPVANEAKMRRIFDPIYGHLENCLIGNCDVPLQKERLPSLSFNSRGEAKIWVNRKTWIKYATAKEKAEGRKKWIETVPKGGPVPLAAMGALLDDIFEVDEPRSQKLTLAYIQKGLMTADDADRMLNLERNYDAPGIIAEIVGTSTASDQETQNEINEALQILGGGLEPEVVWRFDDEAFIFRTWLRAGTFYPDEVPTAYHLTKVDSSQRRARLLELMRSKLLQDPSRSRRIWEEILTPVIDEVYRSKEETPTDLAYVGLDGQSCSNYAHPNDRGRMDDQYAAVFLYRMIAVERPELMDGVRMWVRSQKSHPKRDEPPRPNLHFSGFINQFILEELERDPSGKSFYQFYLDLQRNPLSLVPDERTGSVFGRFNTTAFFPFIDAFAENNRDRVMELVPPSLRPHFALLQPSEIVDQVKNLHHAFYPALRDRMLRGR